MPLAEVAFCIGVGIKSVAPRRRDGIFEERSANRVCIGETYQQSFSLSAESIDMSEFITSNFESMKSVTGVSVASVAGRVKVSVSVNSFDWETLEPIYDKELSVAQTLRGKSIDFSVVTEMQSANTPHAN